MVLREKAAATARSVIQRQGWHLFCVDQSCNLAALLRMSTASCHPQILAQNSATESLHPLDYLLSACVDFASRFAEHSAVYAA